MRRRIRAYKSHLRTPHKLQCFPFPTWKEHAQRFLSRQQSGVHEKLAFMSYMLREDQCIEKKECVHYLLGLSISSIAARSFCLAFLLIWDPRQTFTRLVSCFVEYSCSGGKKRSKFSMLKDMYWSMQGKNRQILSFQWIVTEHYKSVKSRGNYSLRYGHELFTQP